MYKNVYHIVAAEFGGGFIFIPKMIKMAKSYNLIEI
jgi:hypothetical protein